MASGLALRFIQARGTGNIKLQRLVTVLLYLALLALGTAACTQGLAAPPPLDPNGEDLPTDSAYAVLNNLSQKAPVNSLAFSPDGSTLASGDDNGLLHLWSISAGRETQRFTGHAAAVMSIAFSPDGKYLASGSQDHTVRLWDSQTGETRQTLRGHLKGVWAVDFGPSKRILVSGSEDRTVRLWDLSTGNEIRRFSDHSGRVKSVRFSPDGRILASGSFDGTVHFWDIVAERPFESFEGSLPLILSHSLTSKGDIVAYGTFDGYVILWDLFMDEERKRLNASTEAITTVAFSPDDKILGIGSFDQIVRLWNLSSGEVKEVKGHSDWIWDIAFSPASQTLASASSDRTVRLWDVAKGTELRHLKGHTDWVRAVDFAPDGRTLASGSSDRTVRIWNAISGQELHRLEGHSDEVLAVRFSPDGNILASGSNDDTVRLWDTVTGEETKVIKGNFGQIRSLAFSPNSKLLAIASKQKMVHLWSLSDQQEFQRLVGHPGSVQTVGFSPDGKTLLSSSYAVILHSITHRSFLFSSLFAVNRKGHWISCEANQRCRRYDDGGLLLRINSQGRIIRISPPNQKQKAQLELASSPTSIKVRDGMSQDFVLRLRNKGQGRSYWINVVHDIKRHKENKNPLVFHGPPVTVMLEPGEELALPCQVSTLSSYENPRSTDANLKLKIFSAHEKPLQLGVSVRTQTPSLIIRDMELVNASLPAVQVFLQNQGEATLESAKVSLRLSGSDSSLGEKVVRNLESGEGLKLNFNVKAGTQLDEAADLRLVARTLEYPFHVWSFSRNPIVPSAVSYPYLMIGLVVLAVGGMLGVSYIINIYRDPDVIRLSESPQELLNTPLDQLAEKYRRLRLTWRASSVLSTNNIERSWLEGAIRFYRIMNPRQRSEWLADRLGAQVEANMENSPAVVSGNTSLFTLRMPSEFILNMERCLVWFPPPELSAAACLRQLEQIEDTRFHVTLIISTQHTQQNNLYKGVIADPDNMRVVPNSVEQNRLLLSSNSLAVVTSLFASQIRITRISPYRTGGGVNKDAVFFGRAQFLAHIVRREPANYLVVGGRQLGKTSFLKAIQRRYQANVDVECYYVSLAGKEIQSDLARVMGLPLDTELSPVLSHLGMISRGRRRLFLIDEADLFVSAESENNYRILNQFRRLSEEGYCHFILAGFWHLYKEATLQFHSPIKNFGEVLTIGALETDACYELATKPMHALNIDYVSDKLVERIINETGGRANLIAIVCNQLLQALKAYERTITGNELERALDSETVQGSLAGWGSLNGDDEETNRLDRIIVYSTIKEREFSLGALSRTLESHGCAYEPEQIKQSLSRLELSFVVAQKKGKYFYQVPLFRRMV
jgi:WD40 repeat protein